MKLREFQVTKILAGSLGLGEDLFESVERYAREHHLTQAWVQALGAVSHLSFYFYDQDAQRYEQRHIPEKLEILNCTGNVSLKDGKPFPHLHLTCAGHDGKAVGGHLTPGTKVFACEILFFVLQGPEPLQRQFDVKTGLHLWQCNL